MHLAGGGACTDRAVGDQVGVVLREDRVEELAADGQAQARHVEQQLAADSQAGVDVVAAVEVRVVEQALPAERGARLLEVHAHHDVQVVAQFVGLRGEPASVVHGCGGVVDRARADDHDEAVVGAVQDIDGVGAAGSHGRRHDGVGGVFGADLRRRGERTDPHGALLVEIRGGDSSGGAHRVAFLFSVKEADPEEP